MNAVDILKYGNQTFQQTLARVPQEKWEVPGVCGFWSVRQIVAHLASFELALVDILTDFPEVSDGPTFSEFATLGLKFNDVAVARRDDYSPAATLAEYDEAHAQVMGLIGQVPAALLPKAGTLPWYGGEYSLDDFFVYSFYGHKREHSAQIAVFADVVEREAQPATPADEP